MPTSTSTQKFAEHLLELRRRLFWSAIFIVIASIIGYQLHSIILSFLINPLHRSLYYTSPTGGFELIFQVSIISGIVLASPIVVFNLLMFVQPAIPGEGNTTRIIFECMFASFLLTIIGLALAYLFGLPSTFKLLDRFQPNHVSSLISAREYLSFVLLYLGGYALLFQIPLVMLIIHFITPLKPKTLLKHYRYVILFSFILSALITPTGDPITQFIMAAPIILMYFLATGIIYITYYI